MTTHIDTMQEWWKLAEVGIPQAGDTVIFDERHRGLGFHVTQATTDHPRGYDNARILSRALKPRPAWHDAVAVIAHTARFSERRPFALTHTEDVLDPYNTEWITRDDLIDPIPLIEAKVTDEARERVWKFIQKYTGEDDRHRPDYDAEIDGYITAALGLEAA